MSRQIHHPRAGYICTRFYPGEITPDRNRKRPIWQVVKEGRKNIVYVTCPKHTPVTNCGTINKLNKRTVDKDGFFNGQGCFACLRCGSLLVPYLDGWASRRKKPAPKGRSK